MGGREGGGVALAAAVEDLAAQALDDRAHGRHDDLARIRLGQAPRRAARAAPGRPRPGRAASRRAPARGRRRRVAACPPAVAGRSPSSGRSAAHSSAIAPTGPCTTWPIVQPSAPRCSSSACSRSWSARGPRREQAAGGLRVDQGEGGRLVQVAAGHLRDQVVAVGPQAAGVDAFGDQVRDAARGRHVFDEDLGRPRRRPRASRAGGRAGRSRSRRCRRARPPLSWPAAAALFSVAASSIAGIMSSSAIKPRLSAVGSTPMPSRLVSTSRSPACAPAL